MYGGTSDIGGGISGASLKADAGLEGSGIDDVDGWYERWMGDILLHVSDKYTMFPISSSTLFRGIANLVIFLGFCLVAEVGVGAALSVSTASSIRSSTLLLLCCSFLPARSSTLVR